MSWRSSNTTLLAGWPARPGVLSLSLGLQAINVDEIDARMVDGDQPIALEFLEDLDGRCTPIIAANVRCAS
jgi:hypothetical protein